MINICRNKYSNLQTDSNNSEFDMTKVIAIPYYRNISENIRKILGKHEIKVVFRKGTTIRSMLNNCKKPLLDKSGSVYKLSCNNCDAVYIGQTKRKLKFRVNEHKSALTRPRVVPSNVADHAIQHKHDIRFDSPEIAHIEKNNSARKFLESVVIEKCKNKNLTLMNDQENSNTSIPPVYLSLITNKK